MSEPTPWTSKADLLDQLVEAQKLFVPAATPETARATSYINQALSACSALLGIIDLVYPVEAREVIERCVAEILGVDYDEL